MHALTTLLGLLLIAGVLLDAFQTIILPRRPVGRLRITRLFFAATWMPWRAISTCFIPRSHREQSYSIYGPLSLLLLFGVWEVLLLSGFATLYLGFGVPFLDAMHMHGPWQHARSAFYVSASNQFTLGLGDVVPATHLARFLTVTQAGTGLGFLALIIGYVPVLYQAFSQREVSVALLDARAGSPPTAAELLVRHHFDGGSAALIALLAEWERWSATMLETHISYPLLCYYRSQHDNQSWLSALTAVLDTCALLITSVESPATRQAQLTFAVGRHVLVDLGHVFHREKAEAALREQPPQRLSDDEYARLCDTLSAVGFSLCSDREMRTRLTEIRKLYEPAALALGNFLYFELPAWVAAPPDPTKRPNLWTSVANLRSPGAAASNHVSPLSTATHLDDERYL